jgi:glycosyltransferase involved in cell wall biosynthesis
MIEGYTVKDYEPLVRVWSFPLSPRMIADLAQERADIIHVHGYRAIHSELAAWLKTLRNIPFVLSPHGSLLAYRYLPTSRLEKALHVFYDALTTRFVLRKAAFIAVTSAQEAREAAIVGVSEDKIRVMHHAEDPTFLTPSVVQNQPSRTRRLLFVGRISSVMNLATLIQAFNLALREVSDAELLLVGPNFGHKHIGEGTDIKQELLQLCQKLGIEDKVDFTGPVFGAELGKLFQTSDVFIYLSAYGNYGRTHIEAAASGKPVISTPVGIVPDLVGNNEGGFLVDPYDTSGIAQAIVALLSNTTLYQAKQKAILERVKKFLDVKRMVDEYEKLYEEVIKL